jgi:small subunit ribosomal protein S1
MLMMVRDGSLHQHSCIGLIEENYKFRVTGNADFGVFFHITSNLNGLLHITEIKRSGQNLVDFNIGTSYGLYIKSFDVSRNRVSFSLFPTNLSTRNHLEMKHKVEGIKVGDVVSGRVTGIKEFGVFVNIMGNAIGLIHWSELKKCGISKSDFVLGSQIEVIIIAIDEQKKKISLSCKIDY